MSSDFDDYLSNPLSLSWQETSSLDTKLGYRMLDGSLSRYAIGFYRSLVGYPALQQDWDWGKTWEENRFEGALPAPEVLWISRLAVTTFVPLSLLLVFLIGSRLGGRRVGVIAILLLGLHTLMLIHTRRAMAESALVFGVTFSIYTMLNGSKYPWLVGIALAIAISAKFSALSLLPAGLITICLVTKGETQTLRGFGIKFTAFIASFLLMFLLLNPLYWPSPIKTAEAAYHARQALLSRQIGDIQRLAPNQYLDSYRERFLVHIAQVFILPPSFYEVGNYQAATANAERVYLNFPGHQIFRGLIPGGIMFSLALMGIGTALRNVGFKKTRSIPECVLLTSTGFVFISLILMVPIPTQRYSIPLVPLMMIWSAYGTERILQLVFRTSLP